VNFNYLIIAGALSLLASLAHVFIIYGGPKWYRIFGAGEKMAVMAENKSIKPTLITTCIAIVLAVWAIYAWSGAGLVPRMPFLKLVLVLITGVYLVRGVVGLIAPHVSAHPAIKANSKVFWFWSSVICTMFGVIHLVGLVSVWSTV